MDDTSPPHTSSSLFINNYKDPSPKKRTAEEAEVADEKKVSYG